MVAIRRSNGGCLKALAADTTVGSKLQDEEDEAEVSDAHSKLPRIGARTALRGIRTALRWASAAPAAHTRHLIGALFLQGALTDPYSHGFQIVSRASTSSEVSSWGDRR